MNCDTQLRGRLAMKRLCNWSKLGKDCLARWSDKAREWKRGSGFECPQNREKRTQTCKSHSREKPNWGEGNGTREKEKKKERGGTNPLFFFRLVPLSIEDHKQINPIIRGLIIYFPSLYDDVKGAKYLMRIFALSQIDSILFFFSLSLAFFPRSLSVF